MWRFLVDINSLSDHGANIAATSDYKLRDLVGFDLILFQTTPITFYVYISSYLFISAPETVSIPFLKRSPLENLIFKRKRMETCKY